MAEVERPAYKFLGKEKAEGQFQKEISFHSISNIHFN